MSYHSLGGIVTDMYPSQNVAVRTFDQSSLNASNSTASTPVSTSLDMVSGQGGSTTAVSQPTNSTDGSGAASLTVITSPVTKSSGTSESVVQESSVSSGGTIETRRSSLESGRNNTNMANSLSIPSGSQIQSMFPAGFNTSGGSTERPGSNILNNLQKAAFKPATTLATLPSNYASVPPPQDQIVIATPPSPPPAVETSWIDDHKVALAAGGILLLLGSMYALYKSRGLSMSYRRFGVGDLSFSASASVGGGGSVTTASSKGEVQLWDQMCAGKGGVKSRIWNGPNDFRIVCNDGSGCSSCSPGAGCSAHSFGTYFSCSGPGGNPINIPPPVYAPCGSSGARSSKENGGYVYTFCNDDRMFVKDPAGKVQQFSQAEVGGALTSTSTPSATLDVSKMFGAKLYSMPTAPATSNTLYTGTLFSPSSDATPQVNLPVEEGLSMGEKVAIAAVVFAAIGTGVYLYKRR